MKHLLWKDAKTIQPLFWLIVIGIVVINAILCLTRPGLQVQATFGFFVAFWFMIPNLFALGAPALLVGTEEDSGTLAWLRTLPIRWQSVADSKIIVATAGLATTWIVATLFFYIGISLVDLDREWYANDFLNPGGVWFLVFYSLLLLSCGFVTIYGFRTPIVGLLAIIPVMFLLWWILAVTSVSIEIRAVVAMEIGMLLVALICGRLLARRRLRSPQWDGLKNAIHSEAVSVYRPTIVTVWKRPSPVGALNWQQYRQVGMPCLILTAMMVFAFILMEQLRTQTWQILLIPLVLMSYGGPCWLGCMTFYGDNVKQRRLFFAEHGISERSVWWTRMAIPSLCLLAVIVAFLTFTVWLTPLTYQPMTPDALYWSLFMIAQFALGQFVGQWTQRTSLTFLIAPVLLAIGSIVFIYFFLNFTSRGSETYVVLVGVASGVLLLGSRLLVGRWVRGEVDWNYHLRAASVCALAIALPIFLLFSWQALIV